MILDFSFAQESLILDLLLNLSKIWFDEFLIRELLAVQCSVTFIPLQGRKMYVLSFVIIV